MPYQLGDVISLGERVISGAAPFRYGTVVDGPYNDGSVAVVFDGATAYQCVPATTLTPRKLGLHLEEEITAVLACLSYERHQRERLEARVAAMENHCPR